MKGFLCFLVGLAAVSFFAGLQSIDTKRSGKSRPEPELISLRASGDRSAPRQRPVRLPLARGVLDKVDFVRFEGDKLSPVARKLYQLSREDCQQINEAVQARGEELAALREVQEGKAFRIEPTGDWRSNYFWESRWI